MKIDKKEKISSELSKFLLKSLERHLPITNKTKILEDIVSLLMYELLNENLYINIKEYKPSIKLQVKGWPEEHINALKENEWIHDPSSPIVMKEGKLSWKRWDDEMTTTTEAIIQRKLHEPIRNNQEISINNMPSISYLNQAQISAVKSITTQGIVLLSGGPGTGKTSTIIHMIEQILYFKPDFNIGLAAPTGKAAKRLQDSIHTNFKHLKVNHKEKISKIPCKTLHSWLEATHIGFGRNKNFPLNLDLMVIDEMSMVNLFLMKALLEALKNTTKLILVGDPNQLPPIGGGAIWQELHEENNLKKFKKGAIYLDKIYRNRGAIASLSKIIKDDNVDLFWQEASNQNPSSNVQLHFSNSNKLPSQVIDQLQRQRTKLKELVQELKNEPPNRKNISSTTRIPTSKSKDEIFKCLENLMVLCPKRTGSWGINHVHRTLLGKNFEDNVEIWPEGTPIICTENHSDLGLSNGDIGVVIGELSHQRYLFKKFSNEQELIYILVHPARVRTIDPAFSLTIHKSQGSESNQVILLWPLCINNSSVKNNESLRQEEYNKKLLYTAITRAKEKLDLYAINNK